MTRLLIGALLAGVATSAVAADLPAYKAAPAPAVYAPPPFSWTGVYFGVNGGYGWASTNSNSFGNPSGGFVGGTVGANYQMGQFVFGAEGDWDWANLANTQTNLLVSNHMDINQILTARARAGVALDRALFFVTGGYAGRGRRMRPSPYSTALAARRTPGSAAARSAAASNTRSPTTSLRRSNTFTCRCRPPPTSARRSGRSARRTTSACSAPASTTSSERLERRRLGPAARRRASGPRTGRARRRGANGAPL